MEDVKQERYVRAVALLVAVLTESRVENEFDRDIYHFLKEAGELPPNYRPYWNLRRQS